MKCIFNKYLSLKGKGEGENGKQHPDKINNRNGINIYL